MHKFLCKDMLELSHQLANGAWIKPGGMTTIVYNVTDHAITNMQNTCKIKLVKLLTHRRYMTEMCILKSSQFKTPRAPDIVVPTSFKIEVDTSCHKCLSNVLHYVSISCPTAYTYIWISDDENLRPLKDQDLCILSRFPGTLYIPNQQDITDTGVMHLKYVHTLDISGSANIVGWSLIKLITLHSLCDVTNRGRGMTGVNLTCLWYLWQMKQHCIANIW